MKEKDAMTLKDNNLKNTRHNAIIQLIEEESIGTQNELSRRLEEEGFVVTQATISRDIRELRLVKVADAEGNYHYEIGKTSEKMPDTNKFHSIFLASAHKVDYANNLVVIKCYTGMAQAVCATMDSLEWSGIVGTVSGDDTILIVMRDENSAKELVKTLREIR